MVARCCCLTTQPAQHGTPNNESRASAVRLFDWRNSPIRTAVTAISLGPDMCSGTPSGSSAQVDFPQQPHASR